MRERTLAAELGELLTGLAERRHDLTHVLTRAGRLDMETGRKPIGALLFPLREMPEHLDSFAAPTPGDCAALARAVDRSVFALEDAVGLVVLRHLRGASEAPLVPWLVRFGAIHPSQVDDILGGDIGR